MTEKDFIEYEYGLLARDEAVRDNRENLFACGYLEEQVQRLPPAALMGISCGNPTIHCDLQPGMRTLDLGCGGGIDALLSALKVGPDGMAVGIDLLPAMIERAQANAQSLVDAGALDRGVAHFRVADLNANALPFEDANFDRVTGNCCLHFLDRNRVFRDVYRVLRPGGRFVFCEVSAKKPLPAALQALMLESFEQQMSPMEIR